MPVSFPGLIKLSSHRLKFKIHAIESECILPQLRNVVFFSRYKMDQRDWSNQFSLEAAQTGSAHALNVPKNLWKNDILKI